MGGRLVKLQINKRHLTDSQFLELKTDNRVNVR